VRLWDTRRARFIDGLFADIAGEDLNRCRSRSIPQTLKQANGDGIGLLAGRAARNPDANGIAGRLSRQDLRKNLISQRAKNVGFPKEAGDMNQKIPIEGVQLFAVALEVLQVLAQPLDFLQGPFGGRCAG
jgi:hypothetical protein